MPVSTGAQTKNLVIRATSDSADIRHSQSRSAVGSKERNKRTSCSTRVPRPLIDLTRDHGLKLSPSDPSCWICLRFSSCSPLALPPGGTSQLPFFAVVPLVLVGSFRGAGSWPLSCTRFGTPPVKIVQTSHTSGGLETHGELDLD